MHTLIGFDCITPVVGGMADEHLNVVLLLPITCVNEKVSLSCAGRLTHSQTGRDKSASGHTITQRPDIMPNTFAGVRHYTADCQTTSLAVKRRPRRYDVDPPDGRRYSRLSPLAVPVVDGRLGRGTPLNLAGPSIAFPSFPTHEICY